MDKTERVVKHVIKKMEELCKKDSFEATSILLEVIKDRLRKGDKELVHDIVNKFLEHIALNEIKKEIKKAKV